MIFKMMPALTVAALLLAACGSSGEQQPNANAQDLAALNQNPNGGMSANPEGEVSSQSLDQAKKIFGETVGDTVHFDTDSYSLNAEAQAELQKQAGWLKANPAHAITIEGHADERGTREYNLALGDRRAQTIVNYLTALGIDTGRLKEVSFGKERPVCPDSTESCWQQNRRGVTTLDN